MLNKIKDNEIVYFIYKKAFKDILIGYKLDELVSLTFIDNNVKKSLNKLNISNNEVLFKETITYLDNYFINKNMSSFLPKHILLTNNFTTLVLKVILKIPYGKTMSYSDLKKLLFPSLTNKMLVRAIANSLNKNPIQIIYPCHRIIRSNHEVGGYKGSIIYKKKLLNIEGNKIINNYVYSHEISCGAVIYRYKNNNLEFLVEKMSLGHLSLPKGHIEEGETFEETAIREIKEETNIDVKLIPNFIKKTSYSPMKFVNKTVYFFLATPTKNNYLIRDFHDYEVLSSKFYSYKEAYSLLTFNNDKNILKEAYNFIKINRINK